jgi:glycosyltransferase 2 family protein
VQRAATTGNMLRADDGGSRAGSDASRRLGTAGRIALRIVVSAVFVWVALRGLRLQGILDDLTGARVPWLAAALVVLAASYALGALRWRLLARGQDVELGLDGALRYSWIGMFFTNVLPTGFGGDAVRAWIAGRRAGALSRVTASVLMDRLVAAWALVALGAVAVLLQYSRLPGIAILACLLGSRTTRR